MRAFFLAFLLFTSTAYAQTDSGRSGFPVTIVETSEQATRAQEQERKSDAHEAADLDAQVRAAKAADRSAATAERQEVPAWAQIIIAIVGTIIAVFALGLSILTARQSNRTTKLQLRAYVFRSHIDILFARDASGKDVFVFSVYFKNFGQTPARVKRTVCSTRVVEDRNVDGLVWPDDIAGDDTPIVLGPGEDFAAFEFDIPMKDVKRLGPDYRLFYRIRTQYHAFMNDKKAPCYTAETFEVKMLGDPEQVYRNVPPSKLFHFVGRPEDSGAS